MLRLFIVFCCFYVSTAHAFILNCELTPALKPSLIKPTHFGPSNNLARKAGMSVFAKGEQILLKGVVLDEACVPVEGAEIALWQRDEAGHFEPRFRAYTQASLVTGFDPYFAYSGRIKTNNMGQFAFLTVMPGGEKPHVNMNFHHEEFVPLLSRFYFKKDDAENIKGSAITSENSILFTQSSRQVMGRSSYELYVVLKGSQSYRSY